MCEILLTTFYSEKYTKRLEKELFCANIKTKFRKNVTEMKPYVQNMIACEMKSESLFARIITNH